MTRVFDKRSSYVGAAMLALAVFAYAGLGAWATSCKALPADVINVPANAAGCILGGIIDGGLDDPGALLARCGGATLKDVADVTAGYLDAAAGVDGGAAAVDAAGPLKADPIRARVARVHARAVARMQDGAP